MAIYSGISHKKYWFSIAMLNYQRVAPKNLALPLDINLDMTWRQNPGENMGKHGFQASGYD